MLPFKADFFPYLYYGTRLPWILPGYVVHHFLEVMTAKYALHFGFYYLAVFPMYFLLKRAVGPRTALIGAILFGTHSAFLFAIGWDYMDGAGVTYDLLGLACMARAASARRPAPWIVLGGAAAMAMFYTNLFLISFMPCLLLLYLFLRYRATEEDRLRLLFASVLWFGAGVLAITIVLGIINYGIDGHFLFYNPSIGAALALVSHHNQWRPEGYVWLRTAYWLGIPFATGVCSIFYLALRLRRRLTPRDAYGVIFAALFLFEFGVLIAWHIWGGGGLQLVYYVSYLLPLMFLAIGCMLGTAMDEWTPRAYWMLVVCTAGLFIFGLHFCETALTYKLQQAGVAVLVLCAVLGLMATVVFRKQRQVILAALAGLWLYQLGYSGLARPNPHNRDTFLRMVDAEKIVWSHMEDEHGRVLFWYNAKEPAGWEFTSLAAIYLSGFSLISPEFPAVGPLARLGTSGVILSAQPNALEQANGILLPLGMRAEVMAQSRIARGGVGYEMTFFRLAPPTIVLPIRVNAGGGTYTDSLGQVWSKDTGSAEGRTFATTAPITGSPDPVLYQTESFSAGPIWDYRFVVPNGTYTVTLKFAEIYYTSPGRRVFDIELNGKTAYRRLDVFSAAGGIDKAIDLAYPVTVSNGLINITLRALIGYPTINAIEIRK